MPASEPRVPLARPAAVLVASANVALRTELRPAIERDANLALVDEVRSVADILDRVARSPFVDLVVLDRLIPELDDGVALRRLVAASPSSAVVVHPGRPSATASGASDADAFVAALSDVVRGRADTTRFPGVPTPAESRRFVADACARAGALAISDSAELVADELVTNAIRHGSAPIGLHVEIATTTVRIDVSDASPEPPALCAYLPGAPGGRGLRVVGAFAMAWGFRHVIGGKAVWAVLSRPKPVPTGVGRLLG